MIHFFNWVFDWIWLVCGCCGLSFLRNSSLMLCHFWELVEVNCFELFCGLHSSYQWWLYAMLNSILLLSSFYMHLLNIWNIGTLCRIAMFNRTVLELCLVTFQLISLGLLYRVKTGGVLLNFLSSCLMALLFQ